MAAAALMLSMPASGQAGADPAGSLIVREDAADQLEPREQVRAYGDLYRQWQGRSGAPAHRVRVRIARKLALARTRASTARATANRGEKLSLAREAARIALGYLDENDPGRALAWEGICDRILPGNPWAGMVRSRTHDHFRTRLRRQIAGEDWTAARNTLAAWKRRLPADHASAEGVQIYGVARERALRDTLERQGAEAVFTALAEEKKAFPDLKAWSRMRAAAAASLQSAFELAMTDRAIEDARKLVERQEGAEEFVGASVLSLPIGENRARVAALRKALGPKPVQQDYGPVRAPTVTGLMLIAFGNGTAEVDVESFSGSKKETVDEFTAFFLIGLDLRIYPTENSPIWFGAISSTLMAQPFSLAIDEQQRLGLASDFAVFSLTPVVGIRGARWTLWGGMGLDTSRVNYVNASNRVDIDSREFSLIKGGFDIGLSKSVSLWVDFEISDAEDLSRWQSYILTRYYDPSKGMSLGAGVFLAELSPANDPVLYGLQAFVFSYMFQF